MTDLSQNKPTLMADSKTCAVIDGYLHTLKLGDLCVFKTENIPCAEILLGTKIFTKPVRLGHIIDFLNNLQDRPSGYQKNEMFLDFNAGRLDMAHGYFLKADKEIRLTEKEVSILVFFHQNKGIMVTRKDLLSAVWEYAEGVETHTLETHIYRLRQKIETDPANPEILRTQENGYIVLD